MPHCGSYKADTDRDTKGGIGNIATGSASVV